MNKSVKKIIFFSYFVPILFWMGIIFYFSSISGLRYSQEVELEVILRKGAHLFEYIILAFLLWRMFFKIFGPNYRKAYYLSFLIASFYAASDEFHQIFVSGRSGRIEDVLYDIISIFIGLQIIFFFRRKGNARNVLLTIIISISILIGMEYKMIEEGKTLENQKKIEKADLDLERIEGKNSIHENEQIENKAVEKEDENMPISERDYGNNKIPEKIRISVPFTSQAPFSKWDEYHEEACEEASLIMIKYYLDGKTLDKNYAEKEIQDMIKFEIKKYGDYKDTTAKETVKLAEDFYGIRNLRVIYDFKPEDIKEYLAKNKPIIIPAAGRKLGNPNFTAPGPLYHNLVLVGYDGNMVITNDPGTRKGKDYIYNLSILYGAIHDFPGKPEDIEKGRKAMIIIE